MGGFCMKPNPKSWVSSVFWASAVAASLGGLIRPVAAVEAATNRQISELLSALRKGGTSVVYKNCSSKTAYGYYEFDRDEKTQKVLVDQIIVCKNTVDITNEHRLWEVLVHEATHAVQLCYENDLMYESEEHPAMLREIKKFAPHYAELLDQQYVGQHGGPAEIEAFWMELQDPAYAIKEIGEGCPDEGSGASASGSASSGSQAANDQANDEYKIKISARARVIGAKAAADCNASKGLLSKKVADEVFTEFVKGKQMQSWVLANKASIDKASAALQDMMDSKCDFRADASEESIGLRIIKYILD